MKKSILSLLMMLMMQNIFAQVIGDAFYVYRNDGYFNVLYRSEVDSIAYSQYDIDSLYYDKVVTQVFYTTDSIYRIPLNVIDSISFVTPSTIYKSGTTVIDEKLRPYVISHDSMTFVLDASTPKAIIPRKGERLVTTTMDEMFPIGFAGEVVSIRSVSTGIEVACTAVSLEDIFERYFGVSNRALPTNGSRKLIEAPEEEQRADHVFFAPGPQKFDLLKVPSIGGGWSVSYERNDGLAINVSDINAQMSVSFTPVLRGRTDIIVSPQVGVYISSSIIGDFHLEERQYLSGRIEGSIDFPFWYAPPVYIPYSPLVFFNIEVGGFIKAAAEVACSNKWKQDYRSYFFWEFSSKGQKNLNPKNQIFPKEKSTSHEGLSYVNGSVGGGAYINVGFDLLVKDIASANLREEIGLNYTNNYVLTKKDLESAKTSTATYEKLRDSRWSLNFFTQLSFNANVLKFGISHDINAPLFNNNIELLSGSHVPIIEEFNFDEYFHSHPHADADSYSFHAKVSGKCHPVSIKFVAFDEEGNKLPWYDSWLNSYNGEQDAEDDIWISQISYFNGVPFEFTPGHIYTIYPQIHQIDNIGVSFDGILASPSAKMIMYTIQCPDENHPHAIDLGLPSGTLWACCNIGAPLPYEYGDYFAWGETVEKNEYRPGNYQFAYEQNVCSIVHDLKNGKHYFYRDIGDDISGTQYDAATMLWGDGWCMPTLEQYSELFHSIEGSYGGDLRFSRDFNYFNNYLIFCNPDSAQAIVLPPQGFRAYSDTPKTGQSVYIWTSTSRGNTMTVNSLEHYGEAYPHVQYEYKQSDGYYIIENSGNKHYGLPIRPVRKK